ncbi:PREDICTED: uncharacterized protein LOC106118517 [Papilio xuthus]|uniref:Uncharacterized protein LOC106118517 n=1 Tax=Papilio xuthus TaxID=66420 RepID=A0AAJ6ZAQ2_PAPXU|nr:PREDICTED: uncharacterized protein LOC106118517 [Papilio xuthus]
MLSYSLLVLLVIAVGCHVCHGQCHTVASDLNTQWRGADVLERYGRNYYKSLALGPEDTCIKRKRFASVFSEAVLQYFKSNITDRDEAIRDAVAKTEKELYKPADVIGSEFRSVFTYIYSFIDQPLTDVQAVCPYNIREAECEKRFKEIRNERLKRCPGYRWNVELYSTFVFLVTNCGFQNLIVELMRESATGGDLEALNFFIETAAVKFSNVLQFMKDIWKGIQLLPLTCKTISFL